MINNRFYDYFYFFTMGCPRFVNFKGSSFPLKKQYGQSASAVL